MGSLSNQPRGNLSLCTGMYYKAEYGDYQENSGFREAISSRNLSTLSFYLAKSCEAKGEAGCPFFPVILYFLHWSGHCYPFNPRVPAR